MTPLPFNPCLPLSDKLCLAPALQKTCCCLLLLQLLDGEWVLSSSAGPGWGLMWMMWGGGRGGPGADIQECRRRIKEESERGRERREEGALHKLVQLQDAVLKKIKTKAMDEGGT